MDNEQINLDNILKKIEVIQSNKDTIGKTNNIVSIIVGVLAIISIVGGSWLTTKLTTQSIQNTLVIHQEKLQEIKKDLDDLEVYWVTIPQIKAVHKNFMIQYKFQIKEFEMRIKSLEINRNHRSKAR